MTSTTPAPVRRLTRTNDGLTGVSGGLAQYLGVDPVWVRVGILAGSVLTFPLLPIVYLAAWIIVPKQETVSPPPPPPVTAPTTTEVQDAAVAMARARAEVDAIDSVPPSGPMPR